jgi:hypothetical protein
MTDTDWKSLAKAIETSLPKGPSWHREDYDRPDSSGQETSFVADSFALTPPRKLEINLRPDGDVDIRFHLVGVPGSPFEAHFIVHDQDVSDAQDALISFVEDIISERRLFARRKGFIRGGNEFITPDDLAQQPANEFKLLASWMGAFDRGLTQNTA